MAEQCPFCPPARHLIRIGEAAAIRDSFPVNPGHTLVVPVAHKKDIFDCTPEEMADMWRVVRAVREMLDDEYQPAGYNVGANIGSAAGQTVFHCHLHVIPRFDGDTDNPRGGVRRVKQPLVEY